VEETPGQRASLASSNTGLGGSESTATWSGNTSPSGASAPSAPTDDQILYVLHAANLGEMDQARLAQKKAKNARVKRFATMMIKDHGDADVRGGDVAKKTQASLTPSEISNRLENDAKQFSLSISTEKGKGFDGVYIDAQVKEHRAVLDTIERELLPAAKSAEVKELLQTVRPKIENHLQEAEQIQKGLGTK
jgi:putative membrane protein